MRCDLQGRPLREIAFVGRSNVGKSSLINHLTRKTGLAKTSSTPGKTQHVNFFLIDDALCLVDLPGYGFAKVAKTKRAGWGDLIESYLADRPQLALIVLLCDIRHPPSEEDISFAQWASTLGHPIVVVFTKADKLLPVHTQLHGERNFTLLLDQLDDKTFEERSMIDWTTYSIKEGKGRTILAKIIEKKLRGAL